MLTAHGANRHSSAASKQLTCGGFHSSFMMSSFSSTIQHKPPWQTFETCKGMNFRNSPPWTAHTTILVTITDESTLSSFCTWLITELIMLCWMDGRLWWLPCNHLNRASLDSERCEPNESKIIAFDAGIHSTLKFSSNWLTTCQNITCVTQFNVEYLLAVGMLHLLSTSREPCMVTSCKSTCDDDGQVFSYHCSNAPLELFAADK